MTQPAHIATVADGPRLADVRRLFQEYASWVAIDLSFQGFPEELAGLPGEYRRFRDRGRLMPDGIEYRGSWVSEDLQRCFQVMECEDRRLLDQWMANWSDITDFEVFQW